MQGVKRGFIIKTITSFFIYICFADILKIFAKGFYLHHSGNIFVSIYCL